MRKWIITGGAGFIGCHAAARFHEAGDRVVVVDNLSRRGADANLAWLQRAGGHRLRQGRRPRRRGDDDRSSPATPTPTPCSTSPAQVAVTTSVADPRADFEINALGTFNVLEAVRTAAGGGPAVLYSSTNKVYGNLEHVRVVERDGRYAYEDLPDGVDESEPLDFHSPYGCSKGAGDQYVRDYARIYGLKTVVFRQSCIYGTRQFGIEDQGWIAWFCVAVTTGQPFTIFGDGKQIRDTLWVGDLVDAYERALERIDAVSGEVFNIGGGPANTLSLLELVAMLETRFGRKLDPPHADWRPGDQRVFVADVRKAERLLGWRPKVSTAEGVAQAARVGRREQATVHRLTGDDPCSARRGLHDNGSASATWASTTRRPPAGSRRTSGPWPGPRPTSGASVRVFCVNHDVGADGRRGTTGRSRSRGSAARARG